ncbi:HK97 family phage prohead protease [Xanthobacter autotrophicus DSM 597]|uniref:HK97 family phage prohead protease n=1 Tax=Xanthobacter wiegelii TaxID=3119913 RepID=UPI00372A9899
MKTKEFALSIKDVSAEGVVEGYGSTFGGAPDSYGDIVLPGAFAESLAKHQKDGTMPLMLFGHKADEVPIGTWDEMSEDRKGLWVKGTISLDDPLGARVHTALKRRAMRGMSIGYEVMPGGAEPDPKRAGVTMLKALGLWEVSLVNFPANRRATVTSVKSERMEEFARRLRDGEPMPVKEFEDILREAGVPKSMAVQIASVGYAKAIRSESEGEKAKDDALRALKEAAASFLPRT